jgi:outer membrane protein assembly factor BamB
MLLREQSELVTAMELLWEYPLPLGEHPRDYEYEGPLLAHGGSVYCATYADTTDHVRAALRYAVRLHRVNRATGVGDAFDFEVTDPCLPGAWSLTPVGDEVLFHCGAFIRCGTEPLRLAGVPEGALVPEKLAARPAPLVEGTRVYYTNDRNQTLCCLDLEAERLIWSQPLKSSPSYRLGAPLPFGDRLACYGRNALLIVDASTGETVDEIRIPRIDKLYSPLADGDELLLGFTNYSMAGVLRYRPETGQVVWRSHRKFEGPASYCRIWRVGDVLVWVKGETELVGVDAATGAERWRARAAPYLYSRVTVIGTLLLFGTAGRGGVVQVVDALTGETVWSRALNNGCSYYALHEGSVIVGDFDGLVLRLDLRSGAELDRLVLGTEVVGDVLADRDRAYTVAWPDEEQPPRLVCIGL